MLAATRWLSVLCIVALVTFVLPMRTPVAQMRCGETVVAGKMATMTAAETLTKANTSWDWVIQHQCFERNEQLCHLYITAVQSVVGNYFCAIRLGVSENEEAVARTRFQRSCMALQQFGYLDHLFEDIKEACVKSLR